LSRHPRLWPSPRAANRNHVRKKLNFLAV
jgi:hypothetical protein